METDGTSETPLAVSDEHRAFVRGLAKDEVQLLVIRDELYDGSWEEMQKDLEDRRDGKPFVFKLVNRIEEDLERIQRLAAYEKRHGVDLGEYVES